MISIEKWQGLITNASPYAVPGGGFVRQNNIQCVRPGQIESRPGYASIASEGAGCVVAAAQFSSGTVIYVTSTGTVHVVGVTA